MGTDYYSVHATVTCPFCSRESTDWLQTKFMGDLGSCLNYYEMLEPIRELTGISLRIADTEHGRDYFTFICHYCHKVASFGADIVDGAVVRFFSLKPNINGQISLPEIDPLDAVIEAYLAEPYHIQVWADKNEGGYVATVKEFQHCGAQGKTWVDVGFKIRVAMRKWIKYVITHNQSVPSPFSHD